MGTGFHSKLAAPELPARPFEPSARSTSKRKSCLQEAWLPAKALASSKMSTLEQLILRQDWQRILIRANLYPKELRRSFRIHLYGIHMDVLPLHLVCALDPPAAVVEVFLTHFIDSTGMTVRPSVFRSQRHWQLHKKIRRWRESSKGSFPTISNSSDSEIRDVLLGPEDMFAKKTELEHRSSWESNTKGEESDESSLRVSSDSSTDGAESFDTNSTDNSENTHIVQLGSSGDLTMMPINGDTTSYADDGNDGDRSVDGSETSPSFDGTFRVEWDLRPLLNEVAARGVLLPLHVACIMQASNEVIRLLVAAYPRAVFSDVLGMLPIHLVSAGWILPSISEPAPDLSSSSSLVSGTSARSGWSGLAESLQVLCKRAPETVSIRSENHGMTPAEYIEECLEEGANKDKCLKILSDCLSEADHGAEKDAPTCPLEEARGACLGPLIANQDWASVLALVGDDEMGDMNTEKSTPLLDVYGRSPLHLAVIHGAPAGVVESLLRTDPGSVVLQDRIGKTPADYTPASSKDGAEVTTKLLTTALKSLEQASNRLLVEDGGSI